MNIKNVMTPLKYIHYLFKINFITPDSNTLYHFANITNIYLTEKFWCGNIVQISELISVFLARGMSFHDRIPFTSSQIWSHRRPGDKWWLSLRVLPLQHSNILLKTFVKASQSQVIHIIKGHILWQSLVTDIYQTEHLSS